MVMSKLPPHPTPLHKQLPLGYPSGAEESTLVMWSVLRTMYLEKRLTQAQQIDCRREMGTLGGNISLACGSLTPWRNTAKVGQGREGGPYSMGPRAEGIVLK